MAQTNNRQAFPDCEIPTSTERSKAIESSVSLAESGLALFAMALLTFASLLVQFAVSLDSWVFVFLVSKPIVDLTWRWQFFDLFEQQVNVQTIVALMVILLNGIAFIFRKRKLPLARPVVCLMGLAGLSVCLTPTSWGFNELLRLYAGTSLFLTAGWVLATEKKFDRFAYWFLGAVFVPVFLSYFQLAGILPFEYWDWIEKSEIGRVSGTYLHPLGLVYYLIYAIPLALYLLEKENDHKWFPLTFLILAFGALFFTYDRTALVAIVLQVILWLALMRRHRLVLFLTLSVVLVAMVLSSRLEAIYDPLLATFRGEMDFGDPRFLRGRGMQFYVFLHSLYESHPIYWLIGRGGSVASGFVPDWGNLESNEAHNDFIRILQAYGILGLGLYVRIVSGFWKASQWLRVSGEPYSFRLGSLMLVVLPAILFCSLTSEPMRYPTGVWYLFMLGSVVMLRAQRRESEISEKESV